MAKTLGSSERRVGEKGGWQVGGFTGMMRDQREGFDESNHPGKGRLVASYFLIISHVQVNVYSVCFSVTFL